MAKTVDELLEKNRPLKLEKGLMTELFTDLRSGGGGIDQSKQDFYAQQAATAAGRQAQNIAQEIGAIDTPDRMDARKLKAAQTLTEQAGDTEARARSEAFNLSEQTRRGKESLAYGMASARAQRRAEAMNTIVRTAGTIAAAALTGGTSLAAKGLMGAATGIMSNLKDKAGGWEAEEFIASDVSEEF